MQNKIVGDHGVLSIGPGHDAAALHCTLLFSSAVLVCITARSFACCPMVAQAQASCFVHLIMLLLLLLSYSAVGHGERGARAADGHREVGPRSAEQDGP